MGIKIAFPVEGEELQIVTRTGRAPYFAIYNFENGEFQFLELRENGHAKEHHDHGEGAHQEPHTQEEIEHHRHHLRKANLGECKYIVVRALGPNMRDALAREGVTPIKISKKDGERVPDLFPKLRQILQEKGEE
jgi:predicted Fe-Mo cluster-binding NifX family protein